MAAARTRSPFPGMDPYLERHWPSVHVDLIGSSSRALNDVLPPDLIARPEQMLGIGEKDEGADDDEGGGPLRHRKVVPDVRVSALAGAGMPGGAAVAARPRSSAARAYGPLHLVPGSDSPLKRRRVRIFEADTNRLVSVIEFVSPANKRAPGRRDFLRKRARLLRGGVNVVEIDLTRGGPWRRLFGDVRLEGDVATAYRAATFLPRRDGFDPWLFPVSLRDRLPELSIPLRRREEPVPLALQELIDAVYVGGRYGQTIDYAKPPHPPLAADDAAWAAALLAQTNEPAAASKGIL